MSNHNGNHSAQHVFCLFKTYYEIAINIDYFFFHSSQHILITKMMQRFPSPHLTM